MAVYLALLALEYAVEQGLVVLNMRHLRFLRSRAPQQALALLEPETYRRSVDYTLDRSRLSLVSTSVQTFVLALLALTGALGSLEAAIRVLFPAAFPIVPGAGAGVPGAGAIVAGILFAYACSLFFGLVGLPFSLYSQFVIEARHGFNRMSWRLFALDALKGMALGVVLFTPLLYALFALVRATPAWWLWAFGLFACFQILMVYLYPRVIAPLFNRFTPLEEGSLKTRVHSLAERLGVRAKAVHVVDGSRRSAHSNAYFSGFGKAKRIVLFDTLISSLSEDQVAAVLAHEIGHQKRRHVISRIAVSLLVVLAGFWILGLLLRCSPLFAAFGFAAPGAPAAVVLVLYFAGPVSLLLRPLASWWSRRQEYAADRFAGEVAGEGESLRQALVALSRDNLSNPTPHPWYSFVHYSHPTVLERLQALEQQESRAAPPY